MHVGKIKCRDQHRAEDRANTSDRGGGAEHMTKTLDRGVLRRSDHAEDRANTLDRGGGAEHMTDMLRLRAKRCTQHIQCRFKCLCASLSLAPHPKKISKHAPQKNQKAFAHGTEAGSGSHLANQEASGAGKAFAYGTGAGGRSHLAKPRDGARHCAELYTALRDGARRCNSSLSLSYDAAHCATLRAV